MTFNGQFYMVSGSKSTIMGASPEDLSPETLERKLSRIIRFQGMPGALAVSEHMVLCYLLAAEKYGEGSVYARALLVHDVAEAFTGDYHGRHKTDAQREVEGAIEADLIVRGWGIHHDNYTHAIDKAAAGVEVKYIWIGTEMSYEDVALVRRAKDTSWSWLVRKLGCYVG